MNDWADSKMRWSFYGLLALLALSLPAELIFNDQPLWLIVNHKSYLPFLKTYTWEDFGVPSSLPIRDYRGKEFQDFLNGKTVKSKSVEDLFGETSQGLSVSRHVATMPFPKMVFILWALIPHSYRSAFEDQPLLSPVQGWQNRHWLGTDEQGKDVLARLVYGFRISIIFGVALALSGTILGILWGGIQGYFGGWVDLLGQRLTEIWGSLPKLYLLLIFSAFLSSRATLSESQHFFLLFGILNLTSWISMAVYIRAEFLKARRLDYIKSAKAMGVPNVQVMWRHILPNVLIPVITFFPFEIIQGILALASLDFLGLGVRYPAPSLGELLAQGEHNLSAWWIILPTFILLTLTLMALVFIGDGLRRSYSTEEL